MVATTPPSVVRDRDDAAAHEARPVRSQRSGGAAALPLKPHSSHHQQPATAGAPPTPPGPDAAVVLPPVRSPAPVKPRSRRRWESASSAGSPPDPTTAYPSGAASTTAAATPIDAVEHDGRTRVIHAQGPLSPAILIEQPTDPDLPNVLPAPPSLATAQRPTPFSSAPSSPVMETAPAPHPASSSLPPSRVATPALPTAPSPATFLVPPSSPTIPSTQRVHIGAPHHKNPHYGLEVGTLSRVVANIDADGNEVVVGTPVKEGHANYMLMYDMLTGIRVSVSRCNARPDRVLDDADFSAAHKLAFDVSGNEMSPSARYDFKFKDYAPWVFRHIREIFHVESNEYLMSLTGKYVLSELGSPGKSGSFFYYSQDYRFIIKTIHKSEHIFVRKILKNYYEHVKANPETLLTRVFGLHRVKLPGNKKIHFVVMGNVFPANKDVHVTYDLKGSTVGRVVSHDETQRNPRAVLKDLNWVQSGRRLNLGPQKSELLLGQIAKDVEFLRANEIMDYSLLIGCHDMATGNNRKIRDNTLAVFEPNLANITMGTRHRRSNSAGLGINTTNVQLPSTGASSPISSPAPLSSGPIGYSGPTPTAPTNEDSLATMRRLLSETTDPVRLLGPSTSRLPEELPPERTRSMFYREMGGLLATDDADRATGDELYFVGIIDIFTRYDGVKKLEHAWKSLFADSHGISAVNPGLYARRFLDFVDGAVRRPQAARRR
ncbi:Phosphatidylinositol-4-phosphate 5-kinase, partial [Cladochytrium tenue]